MKCETIFKSLFFSPAYRSVILFIPIARGLIRKNRKPDLKQAVAYVSVKCGPYTSTHKYFVNALVSINLNIPCHTVIYLIPVDIRISIFTATSLLQIVPTTPISSSYNIRYNHRLLKFNRFPIQRILHTIKLGKLIHTSRSV